MYFLYGYGICYQKKKSKKLKLEKEIEGGMKIMAVEGNITHKNNIQII
jgi:hypothetical protein